MVAVDELVKQLQVLAKNNEHGKSNDKMQELVHQYQQLFIFNRTLHQRFWIFMGQNCKDIALEMLKNDWTEFEEYLAFKKTSLMMAPFSKKEKFILHACLEFSLPCTYALKKCYLCPMQHKNPFAPDSSCLDGLYDDWIHKLMNLLAHILKRNEQIIPEKNRRTFDNVMESYRIFLEKEMIPPDFQEDVLHNESCVTSFKEITNKIAEYPVYSSIRTS